MAREIILGSPPRLIQQPVMYVGKIPSNHLEMYRPSEFLNFCFPLENNLWSWHIKFMIALVIIILRMLKQVGQFMST